MKYWLIVASKDHVEAAVEGGFCQACHGKAWPMKKLSPGDGIVFYSSKEHFGDSTPYQKFTAMGTVKDGSPYVVDQTADFQPTRRDVAFSPCTEVAIHDLLSELHFAGDNKNWGYKLRRGFLELDAHDFQRIADKMEEI
ncbi:MAG: EVE domain-containing protein [Bacteroidota bacterium]